MTDVCLVLMPYAGIERPSLALGLLKASLKESSISSKVLYPNLWLAEDIGIYKYKAIGEGLAGSFVGEWTFSGAAFPDFDPDHSKYFSTIPNITPKTIQQIRSIRNQAASFVDRVAQSILQLHPRIVSCSSTFHQHCASLALLRRIRELAPEIITVMGGANCEGVMGLATHRAFPWVDFVCSGEGDELFAQLCRKLLDRGRDLTLSELPYGVMSPVNRTGDLVTGVAPRASVPELDRIAIPDYDEYFQTLENSPKIAPYISPGMFVETSRGCWWGQKQHCTFCGLNGEGMTYRSKSPERVVQEFAQLSSRYGLNKFFVVDNILDLKHIDTVLPIFAALPQHYNIFYETKANLKRQQVDRLARAGVRWLQPGLESLHDRMLELMKKGSTALINVQLLKWGRQFGIQVLWNFLVGLPGEQKQWYEEQMEWLPQIAHLQPPLEEVRTVGYHRFSPYHERQVEYGLTLIPHRAYFYIYPLSLEMMQDLAYHFEDGNGEKGLIPEHETLTAWVIEWKKLFVSKQPPMLSIAEDDGVSLQLRDTRPCAVREKLSLEGLAYRVYVECDRVLSDRQLVNTLNRKYGLELSWEEVNPVVEQLCRQKILLSLNGKLLSLAIREPVPSLMAVREQPGGYVDVQRYVRDNDKPFTYLFG